MSDLVGETVTVDLGPVQLEIDTTSVVSSMSVFCDSLEDDRDAMASIALKLRDIAYTHMMTGSFVPLMPDTIKRRNYPYNGAFGTRGAAPGSRPLYASGGTASRLHEYSGKGYAIAQRGNQDWYIALSDKGLGRLDQRQFMFLNGGEQGMIVDLYQVEHVTPAIDAFNGDA